MGTAEQRTQQTAIGRSVAPETGRRLLERSHEHHRRAIVQRVGHRCLWAAPDEAVLVEGKLAEERGQDAHRVYRRADVVNETRKCQLGRACAAADAVGGLEHPDRGPGPSQRDGRSQTVRAGTDHEGIELCRSHAGFRSEADGKHAQGVLARMGRGETRHVGLLDGETAAAAWDSLPQPRESAGQGAIPTPYGCNCPPGLGIAI